MPLALTGGFDVVLAVSDSSFESILESTLLRALPLPAMNGRIGFNFMGIALSFTDIRATVELPPIGGRTFDLILQLIDAEVTAPFNGSLGNLTPAQIALSCTIGVTASQTTTAIEISFDGSQLAVNPGAGASPAIVAAAPLLAAQLRNNFSNFLGALGLTNPLPVSAPIPTVPAKPPAPAGTAPGLAALAISAVPAPPGTAGAARALAVCLTLQDRPLTPGMRAPGNPATLSPFTAGPGADGALQVETACFLELMHSLGLAASLPGVAFIITRAAGIALAAPAAVTLGGISGTLTAFTLAPPSPLTAIPPVLPLAFTFTFVLDSITYTITQTATFTLALAGTSLVVIQAVAAPTVTAVIPWWLPVVRMLAVLANDSLISLLTGGLSNATVTSPPALLLQLTAAGLSGALEATIVGAIAGSAASGATSGFTAPTLPPALTAVFGSVALSPPLSFDDLRLPVGIGSLALVATYRRVDGDSLDFRGESLDLDSGVRRAFVAGAPIPNFGDLIWSLMGGLLPNTGARFVPINRDFNAASASDVAAALAVGTSPGLSAAAITLTSQTASLPLPIVIGVRTSAGRYAKCALWQDNAGDLVLRYLVWDTTAAVCRILPTTTSWAQTDYARDADTPGASVFQATKHERFAFSATFSVQASRVTLPLQVGWIAGSTRLTTSTGTLVIQGSSVTFTQRQQGMQLQLDTALGENLDPVTLTVEVTDANGIFVTDTRVLSVQGTRATNYSTLPNAQRTVELAIDAVRVNREALLRQEEINPVVRVAKTGSSTKMSVRDALAKGGYSGAIDEIDVQ